MDPVALLLADARFPAGSHAHSLGLEQAVRDGLRADDVPGFVAARLELVARADAELALAALGAARAAATVGADAAGTAGRVPALLALDAEHDARVVAPPLRLAARRLGRQLLRTAAAVWPADAVLAAYRTASRATPRPVALGVVAAAAGLDDEALATLVLYDDAATVLSAGPKLLGLDPAGSARWLAQALPQVRRLAAEAVAADAPLRERPGPAAFALDLAAMTHHDSDRRLFAS